MRLDYGRLSSWSQTPGAGGVVKIPPPPLRLTPADDGVVIVKKDFSK